MATGNVLRETGGTSETCKTFGFLRFALAVRLSRL